MQHTILTNHAIMQVLRLDSFPPGSIGPPPWPSMAQVDASIACPLILSEIYRDMALGVQNFVLSDFPQSLKQAPADASGGSWAVILPISGSA